MANLNFYALADDLRALLQFLYSDTDVIAYELSSEIGREVRCFRSLSEIERVFKLGDHRAGHLQLWSRSVMARPHIRRIELTDAGSHTFRYAVEGAGLMQLYLDGIKEGMIFYTHFGHWNEAGARQRSMHSPDECDWKALTRISNRIQRHIRGKLAVAKLGVLPILASAFSALQEGKRIWCSGEAYGADSPDIKRITA